MKTQSTQNKIELKAPRQALFGLIILINFVLTATLLVYSLSKNESVNRNLQGTVLINQLSQSMVSALSVQDTVGLSVIANQYSHLPNINSINVYDDSGELLSEVGDAIGVSGQNFNKNIVINGQVIGNVAIIFKEIQLGDMVNNQLVIFIGSASLHLILFFIYILIAKQFVIREAVPLAISSRKQKDSLQAEGIHSSQQANQEDNILDNSSVPSMQLDEDNLLGSYSIADDTGFVANLVPENDNFIEISDAESEFESLENKTITNFKSVEHMKLNIQFDDPKSLLIKYRVDIIKTYLNLYNELLNKAIEILSNSDLISHQIHFDKMNFTTQGINVTIIGTDKSQAAYASFLLGQLYLLLDEVVYKKRKELKKFVLPCKACIANNNNIIDLASLLQNQPYSKEMMMLLTENEGDLLTDRLKMKAYEHPETVLQRNVGFITGIDETIVNQLNQLRDSILK